MKIRNGFVSNSSSSSFIVKWKSADAEEGSVRWHVNRCVDFWENYYDFEIDQWTSSKEDLKSYLKSKYGEVDFDHPLFSLINIEENTTEEDGVLTTEIFTCMLNDSIRDYGNEASDLVMGILTSPHYELIETYEEES